MGIAFIFINSLNHNIMNNEIIFKIILPKENNKIVKPENYTIDWEIKVGYSNKVKKMSKSFLTYKESIEFEKELRKCAKFINVNICTYFYKN